GLELSSSIGRGCIRSVISPSCAIRARSPPWASWKVAQCGHRKSTYTSTTGPSSLVPTSRYGWSSATPGGSTSPSEAELASGPGSSEEPFHTTTPMTIASASTSSAPKQAKAATMAMKSGERERGEAMRASLAAAMREGHAGGPCGRGVRGSRAGGARAGCVGEPRREPLPPRYLQPVVSGTPGIVHTAAPGRQPPRQRRRRRSLVPEADIVATARSPIRRARKGSLKDVRADDLAAQMIRAALDQVPQLDPTTIDDLQLGCAIPEGHQGGNLARTVAVRLGLDSVPGATVTRFCASSIQTTRAAFHAIASGEARAVISAGVESISMSSGK